MEFFTGGGKWRCTDIGTRVIVAISLELRKTVRVHYDEKGERHEERFMSNDLSDLKIFTKTCCEVFSDPWRFSICLLTVRLYLKFATEPVAMAQLDNTYSSCEAQAANSR